MIFDLLNADAVSVLAENGLQGVTKDALENWIRPLYLVAVAAFAMIFVKDRAWMKLLGFLGIAAIVGTMVFMGDSLFGSNGTLSKTGERLGKTINMADSTQLVGFTDNALTSTQPFEDAS